MVASFIVTSLFVSCFFNRRSNHPNHFPKNPVDRWIYLCVIIVDSSTTLEAIVDADYSSKVLSNAITQPFNNVRLTRLIIGQEQKNNLTDPSFTPEYAFEGRMADLNIWQWNLDEYHVNRWFQGKSRNERPIVAWNTLGYPDKRFGDVHFVSITSAFGRGTFTHVLLGPTTVGVDFPFSFGTKSFLVSLVAQRFQLPLN